jgi:mono/diheme cytochrome c family protein
MHCAVCHGLQGEGQPNWQEPLPDGGLPAPPHDASGHTWHHSDAILLGIIADGGGQYSPQSRMPAFRAVLSDAQMRAILDHIRTFWGPEEREFQAEQSLSHDG